MATSLVIVSSYDPGYLRIVEHLVKRDLAQELHPIVLDVSRAMATPVDSFHRPTLALFKQQYPGHDLRARLSALGAKVVDIVDLPADSRHPALTPQEQSELDISIRSALVTFYRTENPNPARRSVRRSRIKLESEGKVVYGAVSFMLSEYPDVHQVIVPNGRFPHQKLAALAAASRKISTVHYEKGETADGAYLQPYAPQSRITSQSSVEPTLAGLTSAEVDTVAHGWLSRRSPSSDSRNEFSALWDESLPHELNGISSNKSAVAGFFTSSQDEFQALGPEWQLHTWNSQFEAFDTVMTKLETAGFTCFMRVHPNLATKAHDSFLNERRGIQWLAARHPQLLVIWHDESVNSYALLDRSDVVVVWDSTIGLEASARGLPVWTMATSRYGLVADIRELLSPEAVEKVGLSPWEVDAHAAKRFIAYLVLRDSQMDPTRDQWEPWNTDNPPLGVRLSRVLVSGGNPTPSTALQSLVDVYRHRGARASFKSIRSR